MGNSAATDNSTSGDTWAGDYEPVGAWHLSETPTSHPNAFDSTNNGNDGTFNGTMTTEDQVAGQLDGSLDFDGANDYLDLGSSDLLNPGTGSFTVSIWANTLTSIDRQLIGKNEGSLVDWWNIGINNISGNMLDAEFDDGATKITVTSDNAFNDELWHHIIVRRIAGTGYDMFIDGVRQADTEADNGDVANTEKAFIANPVTRNSNGEWLGGVDEVRIYNKALTQADITTIYNMENDNATFLTYGAEETEAVGRRIFTVE